VPEPEPELQAAAEPMPEPELEAVVEPMPEPELEAVVEPMPEPEPELRAEVEPMPELPAPELPEADISPSDAAIAQAPSEPSSPPPAAVARKPKRRNRRGPHSSRQKASRPTPTSRSRLAMSGFADALARAEDPTTADVFTGNAPLPGADDAAEALAAYNEELATPVMEPPATEEAPAMEPPPAETPVPATKPVFVRPGYTTDTPEPDWIAEEDLVVPVSRIPAAGEQIERAGAAVAVADRETDVDEQAAVDEEEAPDEHQAVEEAVHEEVMAEPEATSEEVAHAVEVVAEVVAAEDVEVEAPEGVVALEGGGAIEDPTEPADQATLGMGVTADEWAGPEADMVPEPVSGAEAGPDLASEPPAPDDQALLDALDRFSEPPSIPREPAFWEPEGRSRAPFAIPNLEGWEPADIEALRAELRRFGTAAIPPTVAVGPASVPPPPTDAPPPEIEPPAAAVPTSAPRPSRPVPPSVSPAPPRRPRGPAARAVRRLRRLLG